VFATRCWPYGSVIWTKWVLRKVVRPKAAVVRDGVLIFYDHDGADRFDAQAIIAVGAARARVSYLRRQCYFPDGPGGIGAKSYMRRIIERILEVRPRLEDVAHAEAEVADLLRRKAACEELTREIPPAHPQGKPGVQSGRFSSSKPKQQNMRRHTP
jgi:hypothetical protein